MRYISATQTFFATKLRFPTNQNTGFPALYLEKSGSSVLVVNHNSALSNLILIWTGSENIFEM